jgi:hypothetical protein
MRALLLALAVWPLATGAQQVPPADSSRVQIQAILRNWYFSLAHRDWNAVTADILPAKVVAHRPRPSVWLKSPRPESAEVSEVRHCTVGQTGLVQAAQLRQEGDWAEVWVPRCAAGFLGGDSFRLVYFEQRWRIISIELYERPGATAREVSDRR